MRETIELFKSMNKEDAKEMAKTALVAIYGFIMFIALMVLAGGVQ